MKTLALSLFLGLSLVTEGALRAQEEARQRPAVGVLPETASGRVLAIGDVHGDFETFRRLLTRLELIDGELRWIGGETRCVQLGDLLDRGPRGREALELAMRLGAEATRKGGSFVTVLGNHEVMNLLGDLRYVPLEEYSSYAGEEDPGRREAARKAILGLLERSHPLLHSDYYERLGRTLGSENFDSFFPRGFFAHRAAFSPDGRYGKWLLSRPVVHRDGETLFLHAGLEARFGFQTIEEINARARSELRSFFRGVAELERLGVFRSELDLGILRELLAAEREAGLDKALERPVALIEKALGGMLLDERGPIWSRSLALGSERSLRSDFFSLLRFHRSKRMVVGHTVTVSHRVETRFGHRLILIDTGMNQRVYRGLPSALELPQQGPPSILEVDR